MANSNKTQVIVNGDMSGNLISSVMLIDQLSLMSFSYIWAGTSPVGTVVVEVSNDYSVDNVGNVRNAGTWSAIPFQDSTGTVVTDIAISGNTGNGYVNVPEIGAYAIRTSYNFTSGIGSLQVFFNAKVY